MTRIVDRKGAGPKHVVVLDCDCRAKSKQMGFERFDMCRCSTRTAGKAGEILPDKEPQFNLVAMLVKAEK